MGSSNDGRKKIQRLNEHNTMPIILIGGRMKVFNSVSHILKANWLSKSSRHGEDGTKLVLLVVGIVVE